MIEGGLKPRRRMPTKALEPCELPEHLQKNLAQGKAALTQPLRGITTDGTIVPGLFPLRKTGLTLLPVVEAAQDFLASLSEAEMAEALFDVESGPWRAWHNMHPFLMRHGACFERLSPRQRELGLGVVRATLSAAGFETARDVMKLNEHIGEITERPDEYGEWYYYLSIMGPPSPGEPWGWQLDGHHLIVNAFILGDQLVLTPTFMGSEPCVAHFGKYKGTRVFVAEETAGLALMKSLSPEQRARATIGTDIPREVFGTAFRDNFELRYEGIPYSELTSDQQALLLDLVAVYTGRARPGHDELWLDDVKAHLDQTWFAWAGQVDDVSPFYYRVHSPVTLIEFDHQHGIALDNDEPTRNHIHTVVRTPNGNDYGHDLLRQHRALHDHSHPHTLHRLGLE